MIRRPPRSTLSSSSAASDVYKRQYQRRGRDRSMDDDELEMEMAAAFGGMEDDDQASTPVSTDRGTAVQPVTKAPAVPGSVVSGGIAVWYALPDEIWVGAVRNLSAFHLSVCMEANQQLRRCCAREAIWKIQLLSRWGDVPTNGQTTRNRYEQLDRDECETVERDYPCAVRDMFMEAQVAKRHVAPTRAHLETAFRGVEVETRPTDYTSDDDEHKFYFDDEELCGEDCGDDLGQDFCARGSIGRAFVFGYNCSEEQLESLH
eukprot:TRINITY_DN29904_c0_g1_i1.p1 TRINITY_DN29904_c0_g1~~TRINITY_DN29904_c0_g1_i1.p1  ORF type:complete len:261 (-),score=53.86 TRINITY_DN29904_c0_g1_i1:33-815(-)